MTTKEDILKNESPWGSNPGGGGGGGDGNGSGQRRPPPNIDDIIRKAQGSIGRIFPGGKGSSKPIYFGILILLVISVANDSGIHSRTTPKAPAS